MSRYYSGNWENIVAKWARKEGIEYHEIRPEGGDEEAITDENQILETVELWKKRLNDGLAEFISTPMDWNEAPDSLHFTNRPYWEGYASLILLAAHLEHPELPVPKVAPTAWADDRAYLASASPEFRSRFANILFPEIWLPTEFRSLFRIEDLAGRSVYLGSSHGLVHELESLNLETFRGTQDDVDIWVDDNLGPQRNFDQAARFGLAVFLHHAKLSIRYRLPMKLDY